jgi:hypothetical protein
LITEAQEAKSGQQLGDPGNLAAAVLALAESANHPPQILLGSDSLSLVSARIERLQQEIKNWKSTTVSTDG